MFGLGPTELIIILVIVILIFGAGKLGSVGSALGKSIRDFREASGDTQSTTVTTSTPAGTTVEKTTTVIAPTEEKKTGI